jgi:hypothetical protein
MPTLSAHYGQFEEFGNRENPWAPRPAEEWRERRIIKVSGMDTLRLAEAGRLG